MVAPVVVSTPGKVRDPGPVTWVEGFELDWGNPRGGWGGGYSGLVTQREDPVSRLLTGKVPGMTVRPECEEDTTSGGTTQFDNRGFQPRAVHDPWRRRGRRTGRGS